MAEPETPFQSDNPIVQRLLAGTAPAPIKLAAARGALPITPEEQFWVLGTLAADPDPALAEALRVTLDGLADEPLASLIGRPGVTAAALDFYARRCPSKTHTLQAIASHRAVGDDTLNHLAAVGASDLLEIIVTNQVALIRVAGLLDTLLANPAISADQRRRALEVREEFFVKKEREEQRKRDEEARLAKLREKKEWTLQELERLQEELAKEAQADREVGTLATDGEEAVEESEEEKSSAYQRLLSMSVPEKILVAIRGSRTERNLLIRDANRLVATSVLKSPKVSEKDIEYYAGLRNVVDDIPRMICNRRDWLRTYSIILTLVKNPRTPLAMSINLLGRLQMKDIKLLEGDRNVSETLRRQAKQHLEKAAKAGGSR